MTFAVFFILAHFSVGFLHWSPSSTLRTQRANGLVGNSSASVYAAVPAYSSQYAGIINYIEIQMQFEMKRTVVFVFVFFFFSNIHLSYHHFIMYTVYD